MAFGHALLFTHRQKRGILLLFLAIFFVSGGFYGFSRLQSSRATAIQEANLTYLPPIFEQDTVALDVNLADSSAWASLPGIGPVLSRRILRYRQAIGGFSEVEELNKVYGLDSQTFARIRPFLFVNAITAPAPTPARQASFRPRPRPEVPHLDLNQATAAELAQLPGIGAVLSTRIVKYRDLIGGYDSTAQLARVYGLPAETLTEILPYLHLSPKPEPTMLAQAEPEGTRKEAPVSEAATSRGPAAEATRPTTILDLNQADSLALVALPGIGPVLSARILKYRDKLGFFYAPEQLRMIYGLSEENYQRMRPYLKAGIPTDAPKLDLNTVNRYTLRYYPHLGEEGADRLLAHRRKLGRFGSWQEVAQCPGLTPEALVVLKAYFSL